MPNDPLAWGSVSTGDFRWQVLATMPNNDNAVLWNGRVDDKGKVLMLAPSPLATAPQGEGQEKLVEYREWLPERLKKSDGKPLAVQEELQLGRLPGGAPVLIRKQNTVIQLNANKGRWELFSDMPTPVMWLNVTTGEWVALQGATDNQLSEIIRPGAVEVIDLGRTLSEEELNQMLQAFGQLTTGNMIFYGNDINIQLGLLRVMYGIYNLPIPKTPIFVLDDTPIYRWSKWVVDGKRLFGFRAKDKSWKFVIY